MHGRFDVLNVSKDYAAVR